MIFVLKVEMIVSNIRIEAGTDIVIAAEDEDVTSDSEDDLEVIAVTNENESEDETSDENEATDEEDFVGKAQVPVVTRTSRRAAQYLVSSAAFVL